MSFAPASGPASPSPAPRGDKKADRTPPVYTLWQLIAYMLKLGTLGFGGPVALVSYMHRDLVERRNWVSAEDYKEGLALAQLAPGPLAAQLAIYLGYVHYRLRGATLAGIAFALPSFFMVVMLGWAYTRYGGLGWMQAVFYGVSASVIGVIALSAKKLTQKNIGSDPLLWGIYLVLAATTIFTESEVDWLFVSAGLLVWALRAPPRWLRGGGGLPLAFAQMPGTVAGISSADWPTLLQLAGFFAKAGAFVFGSGLAIIPFLYSGVVSEHHWLTERQFMDAVAVAMITPGPVVITVAFIGYLVAGFSGATVAALAIFLPCYAFTVIPAPYFKKYGKAPAVAAFVDGITAAAIGAITGSVIVLAKRSLIDGTTVAIAVASAVVLWRFKRVPEPLVIVAAALLGLLLA